jgi:membrane associated rhomboid family serine protease
MIPFLDTTKRDRVAYATYLIIVANVFAFIVEHTLTSPVSKDDFMQNYALVPNFFTNAILSADPRLIWIAVRNLLLAMSWHENFEHIFGNMAFFFAFGRAVEDRVGHARFVIIYLMAGVAGFLLQTALNLHAPIIAIGASGAVAGILGAYVVLFPRGKVYLWTAIYPLSASGSLFLVYWIFENAMGQLSSDSSSVAFAAHIAGFFVGFSIALLIRLPSFLRWFWQRIRRRFRAPEAVNPEGDVVDWVQQEAR